MSMYDAELRNVPWWRRGAIGAASEPFRNAVGNIRHNPGHQPGQPMIGLGPYGGSGKRDQFLGAAAVLAAPFAGPSLLRAGWKAATTPIRPPLTPLSTLGKVGLATKRTLGAWGLASQVAPAKDAWSATKTAFGSNPSEANIRRTYASLLPPPQQSKLQRVGSAFASTPYEVPFSQQGTAYGRMGNTTDATGFVSGFAHRAATQKLAGLNPWELTRPGYYSNPKIGVTYMGPVPGNLMRNIGRSSLELGVGLASRYIEKPFPGVKKFGSAIGWAGGAGQAMLTGPSRSEAERAREELRRKYPWLR